MLNDKLNIGIIGLGRWGQNILKTLLRVPDVNLACVASRNNKIYKLIPNNCKVFIDWNDLIEYSKIDGLIVATPSETHYKIAKKSLSKGINTLVEKPLTLDLEEAETLKNLSKIKKTVLMTEFTQIFNPKFQKLKSSLNLVGNINSIITEAGNIGPVRRETSVLWDWGCHELSILINLLGSTPEKINAKKIEEKFNANGDESSWEISCNFGNSVKSKSFISNMIKKKRKVIIKGDSGVLFLDDVEKKNLKFLKKNELLKDKSNSGKEIIISNLNEPLYEALLSFFTAIKKNDYNHWSLNLGIDITSLLSYCSNTHE